MNSYVLAIIAIFASTGFWQFIMMLWQSKQKNDSALEKAVKAILHDKIYDRAEQYIRRDGITVRELDNLRQLYEPYKALGGNGTGQQLYETCLRLHIITEDDIDEK